MKPASSSSGCASLVATAAVHCAWKSASRIGKRSSVPRASDGDRGGDSEGLGAIAVAIVVAGVFLGMINAFRK